MSEDYGSRKDWRERLEGGLYAKLTNADVNETLEWAKANHGECPREGCQHKQWPSCNYAKALLALQSRLKAAEAVVDASHALRAPITPNQTKADFDAQWDALDAALAAYDAVAGRGDEGEK